MSIDNSQRIIDIVNRVKARAKRAEERFDTEASNVELLASQTIELFGGQVASSITDVVTKAKAACDTLYAEYQSLVQLLDSECRPLLNDSVSKAAIQAVHDQIKWLNDESEIENNYTASLNTHSLGDVASVKYFPSVQCRSVQSFWEAKCDMFVEKQAGIGEARQPLDVNLNEAQKDADFRLPDGYLEAAARYKAEMSAWSVEVDTINERRKKLLYEQVEALKAKLYEKIVDKYNRDMSAVNEKKEKLTSEKEAAEQKLAQLGFFAFAEKQACRAIIEGRTSELVEAEDEIRDIQAAYVRNEEDIPEELELQEEELKKQIEAENPLPEKPKPEFDSKQLPNTLIKNAILRELRAYGRMTIADILDKCPECATLSNIWVASLMRQLRNEGKAELCEEKNGMYFRAK